MKILYLAHRIPYPPNKGDKIRSFNEIKHLSGSHEIDLACLVDDPADMQYESHLKRYCNKVFLEPLNATHAKLNGIAGALIGKPLSIGYFYSRSVQRTVDQWLSSAHYDCVICFSSPMAEYIFRSKYAGRTRLIMDFCDVDSDKWDQYAKQSSFPQSLVYASEKRRLARYERIIADSFQHCVFVSEKEAGLFKSNNPAVNNISVIPNGVDHNYFNPDISYPFRDGNSGSPHSRGGVERPPILLFTGAMDYYANEDGVRWFCKEILPRIRIKIPDVRFLIVGRNPRQKILDLEDGLSIRVTGYVEDTRPYYSEADVCVIPLRIARGVQNKLLEAMAMGKAIVAASASVAGLNASCRKSLLLADSPEGFADAVLTLLKNHDMITELGASAREYVKWHYIWPEHMNKFESVLFS